MKKITLAILATLTSAAACVLLGLLFCYTPLFRMLAPVNGYDYFLAMALVYGAWILAGVLGAITSLGILTIPGKFLAQPGFLNLRIVVAVLVPSVLYLLAFFVDGDWVIWANIVAAALIGSGVAHLWDRRSRSREV